MSSSAKKIKLEFEASTLECPVCLDVIMDPPIFICENSSGHSLCSNCHEGLIKNKKPCPVCRKPLKNRRNITLEHIVACFPGNQCKFEGCHFKRSKEEVVKAHEEDCEKRYVPCALCDAKVVICSLVGHLTKKHHRVPLKFDGFSRRQRLRISCTMPRTQSVINVLGNEQNPTFLFNVNNEKSPTIFWVSCITSPKNLAESYTYTIQVLAANQNNQEGKPVFVCEGTRLCVPCDLSHDEVRESAEYFVLGQKTQAKALGEDGRFESLLTISKNEA